jgi:hypothetical protein
LMLLIDDDVYLLERGMWAPIISPRRPIMSTY